MSCATARYVEEVALEIIRCKCIPILLYCTEAFMLNKSELSSLGFVINRLFMKLFRTNNIETVEFCQDKFGFDKPNVLWARRVRNFDSKFVASENAFCKLHCPYSQLSNTKFCAQFDLIYIMFFCIIS